MAAFTRDLLQYAKLVVRVDDGATHRARQFSSDDLELVAMDFIKTETPRHRLCNLRETTTDKHTMYTRSFRLSQQFSGTGIQI